VEAVEHISDLHGDRGHFERSGTFVIKTEDSETITVPENTRSCSLVEGKLLHETGAHFVKIKVNKLGNFIAVGVVGTKIEVETGATGCADKMEGGKGWMYAYHGYTYHQGKGSVFGITDTKFQAGDEIGILLEDMPEGIHYDDLRQVSFYLNGELRNGGPAFVDLPRGLLQFAVDLGGGASCTITGMSQMHPAQDPAEQAWKAERDALYELVDALADAGTLNTLLLDIYNEWPITKDPELVGGRLTWPLTLEEFKTFIASEDVHLDAALAEALCKVLEHRDTSQLTWPKIQRAFLHALQYNVQYGTYEFSALSAGFSLVQRKSGFAKKVHDMGREKTNAYVWGIYRAWDTGSKEPVEIDGKLTWPLTWAETDELLQSESVAMDDIGRQQIEQVFFSEKPAHVREGISTDCVIWPDVQQIFREAAKEAVGATEWSNEMEAMYPSLSKLNTLRCKSNPEMVQKLLEGEFRVYCRDASEPPESAQTYSLIVESYDPEGMTFTGHSKVPGKFGPWKYTVQEGKCSFDPLNGRVTLSYTEEWEGNRKEAPVSTKKIIGAQLKTNGKFHSPSGSNILKARRIDSFAGDDDPKMAKYFIGDKEVPEPEPEPAAKPESVGDAVDI